MTTASKVTQKGQATIPAPIRKFLSLGRGDRVVFDIEENKVVLKKSPPIDLEYLGALETTLSSEWSSKADSAAYDDL